MFEISLIALRNMLVGKGETKRDERDIGADAPTIRTVNTKILSRRWLKLNTKILSQLS